MLSLHVLLVSSSFLLLNLPPVLQGYSLTGMSLEPKTPTNFNLKLETVDLIKVVNKVPEKCNEPVFSADQPLDNCDPLGGSFPTHNLICQCPDRNRTGVRLVCFGKSWRLWPADHEEYPCLIVSRPVSTTTRVPYFKGQLSILEDLKHATKDAVKDFGKTILHRLADGLVNKTLT
ncbi:uncharacterized protein LOC132205769 [Neocloeon triangulifer]|uniref:uncharacterized protein LOC132205769 n=1 Tax=Neocloeon triangulifer TaxID=2078957 RepID=UPI00286FA21A|nr:uncharacterized protein LOC132205769 [Neocloeon triangulifer]